MAHPKQGVDDCALDIIKVLGIDRLFEDKSDRAGLFGLLE